ncbi:MAG: hypothetical protein HKN23_05830, partial [Verrucomicrobiales bacterium]|nr:hypothetical protein [Verrucomicrobiales bacterium]
VLNASVVQYNEITPDNVDDFHFHGDESQFPVTAAIVIPREKMGGTILKGRYQETANAAVQLADPEKVTDELFKTVFQIRDFVVTALVAVGLAALGTAVLVFLLSNKLRTREFSNLRNLGADPATIRMLIFFETASVLLISATLAAVVLAGMNAFAPGIVRAVLG